MPRMFDISWPLPVRDNLLAARLIHLCRQRESTKGCYRHVQSLGLHHEWIDRDPFGLQVALYLSDIDDEMLSRSAQSLTIGILMLRGKLGGRHGEKPDRRQGDGPS